MTMFDTLEAEYTDEPVTRSGRGSGVNPLDGTPIRDWVAAANSARDKSIRVPGIAEADADRVVQLIRRAAAEISVGVAFAPVESTKGSKGKVTLRFAARDRRQYDQSPEAVALRERRRAAIKALRDANPAWADESKESYGKRIRGLLGTVPDAPVEAPMA